MLTKLDKAKTDFIASASHQLRSPLSVIKGIASMLIDGSYGKVSGQIKNALEKVYISNERLIGLIESLLNISHLEEGRVEFVFTKIDLNSIAQKAVDGLALQAQNKKLYLKFSPFRKASAKGGSASGGKLLVWADESKVTEAISNLIDNALKYTRKGGVTVEIKKISGFARVTVRDTGIGLKKEEKNTLFQKFVRAGRGNKMSVVGTGLGLYVVRKMIEAHKGKIWADSLGEGRGSSFIIELPLDLKTPPDEKFVKRVVMEKANA
jgi:signal transduction histidine kinase